VIYQTRETVCDSSGNIERFVQIIFHERSKELTYSVNHVSTHLWGESVPTPDHKVLIATDFRAGLAMHTGCLNMFHLAETALAAAYRYCRIRMSYRRCPVQYITTPELSRRLFVWGPKASYGKRRNWIGRSSSSGKTAPLRIIY